MLSHDEWLQSEHTVALLRWLEKKRAEHTASALHAAVGATGREAAAEYAGRVFQARDVLDKIRERKPNDESV